MRAQMSLTAARFGALVVTSGDAPEVLDAVEKALDKVPLPVPENAKRCLRLERDGMLVQAFLRAAASRMALLS